MKLFWHNRSIRSPTFLTLVWHSSFLHPTSQSLTHYWLFRCCQISRSPMLVIESSELFTVQPTTCRGCMSYGSVAVYVIKWYLPLHSAGLDYHNTNIDSVPLWWVFLYLGHMTSYCYKYLQLLYIRFVAVLYGSYVALFLWQIHVRWPYAYCYVNDCWPSAI